MKRFINFTFALIASFQVLAETDCDPQVMTNAELVNSNFPELVNSAKSVTRTLKKTEGLFILVVNNKCKDTINLAIAFEGKPSIDMNGMGELFATKNMSKGWWTIEPGISREIVIDHELEDKYFLHARTEKVFWGKSKEFKVMTSSGERSLMFSEYSSPAQCTYKAAKGYYYCTHDFNC